MKRTALFSIVLALAVIFAHSAKAQNDVPVVPVTKAPFHLPVFTNDYITLLNVYIPAGARTSYHMHTGESVSINVEEGTMLNQDLGDPDPKPVQPQVKPGNVSYTDYRSKPRTHRAINAGSTPYHNLVFIFRNPQPSGFAPSSRADVAAYERVLDNNRVRGWRLKLDPGQSAPAITQLAPGFRIIVKGGLVAEIVPGQSDRPMNPRLGEFYWQDPGVTRSIRNIGATPIEFLEFELK
jgi:hypothetical protein